MTGSSFLLPQCQQKFQMVVVLERTTAGWDRSCAAFLPGTVFEKNVDPVPVYVLNVSSSDGVQVQDQPVV